MNYKDGDTITVNGKPCRIEGGALVPVVERGPLGGELKTVRELAVGESAYFKGTKQNGYACSEGYPGVHFDGVYGYLPFPENAMVETNIPPRPQFIPTTAGEAAKLPDIVGQWVALRVDRLASDNPNCLRLCGEGACWPDPQDKILLIEGVDLP